MARLISRKIILILLIIPLLHMIGFYYATTHPYFYLPRYTDGEELNYGTYIQEIIFDGDLGNIGAEPLTDLLQTRIYNSMILVLFALAITAVGGILIGMASISSKTGKPRPWLFTIATAGASLPGFLLAGVAIAIAVYQTLYGGLREFPFPLSGVGFGNHLILPMVVLALRPMLHLAKLTMGLLEDELSKEYIRTAKGKGARTRRVYWRHALANMWAPIIAVLGQSIRFIVGGLLIAEIMFSWPGIGQLFVFSIVTNENFSAPFRYFANPYLISSLFVTVGLLLLTADLIAGIFTRWVSPRVRYD